MTSYRVVKKSTRTPKKKRRFVLIIIILCILIAIPAFFSMGFRIVANQAIQKASNMLGAHSVKIHRVHFKDAKALSLTKYALYNIHASFDRVTKNGEGVLFSSTFQAHRIMINVHSFLKSEITFSLESFALTIEDKNESFHSPFERLTNGHWRREVPIPILDFKAEAKDILFKTGELFSKNHIDRPFLLEADVILSVDSREAKAHLYTVKKDGTTTLRFKEEDIKNASETFNVGLTEAGIKIISSYPLRTVDLFEITYFAINTSKKAKKDDPSVPEDAYRHVMWSYLLTKRFNPEFAELVTDAHETRPGNTPEERQMDYHNNEVGRRYAQENISQDELIKRIKTDPIIIRNPDEVRTRFPEKLKLSFLR